jgi:hypothetical protein
MGEDFVKRPRTGKRLFMNPQRICVRPDALLGMIQSHAYVDEIT